MIAMLCVCVDAADTLLFLSIQAVNFLNAMAREVDFDKLEPPEMPFKGPQGGHQSPFAFDPMRRKAHVFDSDSDQ